MDAAIYARLSKNRSGLSDNVEIQIAEGKTYSEEKTWPVVGTFSDDDISASKFSTKPRPGYDLLVAAIQAGQIEVIICTEMTRLYRRIEELLSLIKMAETTRLRGIWTTDDIGYDLSTPEGIHAAIAAINNAQLESAKLSKRIKRKKAVRAKQGMPNGGGRPYGFEADGVTLRPSEVEILVEAKDRYLAGETMRDIVRDFCAREIVSPYGKPWMIENFQRVLFSKRYIGIRVHNEAEYPAQWPAIFTHEEWDLMNARRIQRATKYPGRPKGAGRKYLLTGIVFCGRCGQMMVGSRRDTGHGHKRRYRCRGVDNHGAKVGCGRTFRDAEALDAFITEVVLYRFDTPEVAKALYQSTDKVDTDELITAYQSAKTKLDTMVADYASGFLTRSQFAVAKQVAEDNLQAARDALAKAQNKKAQALLPATETIREAWNSAGLDWKLSVIKLLVERVTVHPAPAGGSKTWKHWRFDPDSIEVSWVV